MEEKVNCNDLQIFVKGKEITWTCARDIRDFLSTVDFSIPKNYKPYISESTKVSDIEHREGSNLEEN